MHWFTVRTIPIYSNIINICGVYKLLCEGLWSKILREIKVFIYKIIINSIKTIR